jgi:gamma-glutamyl-gamma-aminobutyrate hydrolase PuuD
MVPFAGDLGLTRTESEDYIEELNRRFPSFIGMGGDDVDWRLLGKPIGESVFYNAVRDLFEIKLYSRKIKTIMTKEKLYLPDTWQISRADKLFVTCRAYEIVAALTGHDIKTHIAGHGSPSESEPGKVSKILRDDYNLHALQVKRGSYFANLVGPIAQPNVVTSHHQCVIPNANAWTQVVAKNPGDGCPEVIESADGNIIGVQGHFEIQAALKLGPDTAIARAFMQRVMIALTSMRPNESNCQRELATGT